VYRQKVAALHEALAVEGSRDQAFELIRSLVDKVVLTPVNGKLRIDLHGDLAGILRLCQDGKTPRP
jgi:site-specific DNA recombinase